MLVSHRFGPYQIQKDIAREAQFLLRNRLGGFFFYRADPASKYHGLWTRHNGKLYKSVAAIKPGVDAPVRKATNYFWGFSVERGNDFHELFFMDPESDSLVYQTKNPAWFGVTLDGREQSDQDEWGRLYDIAEQGGCLVMSYTKRVGEREAYQWHCAVAGYTDFELKKEWVLKRYVYDELRQDPPFERHVYSAVNLKGSSVVFSVGAKKEEAIKAALDVSERAEHIKNDLQKTTDDFARRHDSRVQDAQISIAHLAARFSAQGMTVRDHAGSVLGVYAGIPWFTQFWFRDSTLSANQLDPAVAKSIFLGYGEALARRGNIEACDVSCMSAADTELLFFACASDLISRRALDPQETDRVKQLLIRYLDIRLAEKMRGGFVVNGPKETWMDTEHQNSSRAGARIEIQALALRALHLAWELTGDPAYRAREYELVRNVRMAFWDGAVLSDGLADATLRPNIFLAHLFYPELLLRHEWEAAFATALEALWLPWGGLATLPKTHPLFCGADRAGKDPNQSYHHGDSWFFLNNIAARALAQVNARKFKPFIDALLSSSTDDILWSGILGNHSEVSSADEYAAAGCLAQTWSAATYADALDGIMAMNRKT